MPPNFGDFSDDDLKDWRATRAKNHAIEMFLLSFKNDDRNEIVKNIIQNFLHHMQDEIKHGVTEKGDGLIAVAIKEGFSDEFIEFLLTLGISPNLGRATGPFGRETVYPLHEAVERPVLLKALLKYGADANQMSYCTFSKKTMTPIENAVSLSCAESLRALLEYGAKLPEETRNQKRPIFADVDDPQITQILIEYGANLEQRDKTGKKLLHRPLSKEAVDQLINKGINLFCKDFNGNTVLHFQTQKDVIEKLMDHGLSIHARNANGIAPLHQIDDYELFSWLAHRTYLVKNDPCSAWSFLQNKEKFQKDFPDFEYKKSHPDDDLKKAVDKGALIKVESLLKSGADPNALLDIKPIIVHVFESNHSYKTKSGLLKMLIEHGGDINQSYAHVPWGQNEPMLSTPVHELVSNQTEDNLKILDDIKDKIDPKIKNFLGQNPLIWAAFQSKKHGSPTDLRVSFCQSLSDLGCAVDESDIGAGATIPLRTLLKRAHQGQKAQCQKALSLSAKS